MKSTEQLACLFALTLFFTFLIVGCTDDTAPHDLIPEDTYIDLIVEFEMIYSLHGEHKDSVLTASLIEKVLENYGITQDRFERSHAWYDQQINEQLQRFRKALDRLNEEAADI